MSINVLLHCLKQIALALSLQSKKCVQSTMNNKASHYSSLHSRDNSCVIVWLKGRLKDRVRFGLDVKMLDSLHLYIKKSSVIGECINVMEKKSSVLADIFTCSS